MPVDLPTCPRAKTKWVGGGAQIEGKQKRAYGLELFLGGLWRGLQDVNQAYHRIASPGQHAVNVDMMKSTAYAVWGGSIRPSNAWELVKIKPQVIVPLG